MRVLSLSTVAAGRSFHARHAEKASIIIQSIAVEWGLHVWHAEVFFFLLVSVTFRLASKVQRSLEISRVIQRCPAIRNAYVSHCRGRRLSSCSLCRKERWGARLDDLDDIGFMFRFEIKVPLLTSVKASLVPKSTAWFRNDSHLFSNHAAGNLKSPHIQNGHFGLKLHRNNNLVTAIEAMPSTNEQACVRMVRHFGWESDQGGGFCKPRLKLNPVDLSCRFFRCTWW